MKDELGEERGAKPYSLLDGPYTQTGTSEIEALFGNGKAFSFPKPVGLIKQLVSYTWKQDPGIVLDFFAGSGTTAHAVINLNREDGGQRRYILVEMGEYFDTVLKPRIEKVVYSKDWKDGKPVSREGSSHMLKYIRLESYEDTLNNLQLRRLAEVQALLDELPGARQDYLLHYMLDLETRDSASLLDIHRFEDPFSYRLNITEGGESRPVAVDLVETFNWLLGLKVEQLRVIGGYHTVEGTNPEGERVLVIWRRLSDPGGDDEALRRFFIEHGYGSRPEPAALDRVYVNGDCTLASLLSFYQQRLAWEEHRLPFAPYGVERPLWVFVGGSVTKTLGAQESSDVIAILRFLARFLENGAESVALLDRLLSGNTGLSYKGRDVFAGKLGYLVRRGGRGEELYRSVLARVFNTGGGRLHVEELKGTEGELSLRVGDSEPFGVINVGDARALAKKCADYEELTVSEREFSGSLFGELNRPESRINLLIGSKKFTEGWSSWRVSSMGLMNVGKGEGAQIIQMFGRGVRLKGLEASLKRSTAILDVKHPRDLDLLKTLNVFGVRADYMAQFREYLEAEGVPSAEKDEIALPVVQHVPVGKLKSIRLRDGGDFKRDAPPPRLGPPPEAFRTRRIPLDWYPKLEALESESLRGRGLGEVRHAGKLSRQHLAFLDLDAIHSGSSAVQTTRAVGSCCRGASGA